MTIHERQEIAEAILNELHYRRYNEAIANGCDEKDAMTLADNWELYKDAKALFKFYVDLAIVSNRYSIEDIEKCVEHWGLCKVEKEYIERFLNGC